MTAPTPAAIESVAAVDLRRVRLPLIEPFVAAHGTEHEREVVLVHVVGYDGRHGWGECVALSSATYRAETTASAWVALRDVVAPRLLAAPEPEGEVGGPISDGVGPMAWAAVETALVDLELRRSGRSLVGALGAVARPLDACAVVGLQVSVDATVAAVGRRVAEGYRSVKLKIDPGRDLDRIRAVRSTFGDLGVAADANGSYTLADRSRLERLGALGLDYLEQPLPATDLVGLAQVASHLPVTVALDESIGSLDDLDRAIEAGAGSVLNLKPGPMGGIAASLALAERARTAGWGAFVGGMLETGVGRSVALAVASLDSCTLPTDLGPSDRYFAVDVTAPVPLLDGGRIQAPDGPGIGVVPRGDRLDDITVDRALVKR